jgi:hypothetical protein
MLGMAAIGPVDARSERIEKSPSLRRILGIPTTDFHHG